jgi:ABC-type Zn uptake system ZnuABC Zn-binding protein ZnuA
LAQLYISQGAHAKAREIYKTLGKIHPEKADQFKKQAAALRQTRSKKT